MEFVNSKESIKNVGGLENLKQWIEIRQDAFTDEARSYGIPNLTTEDMLKSIDETVPLATMARSQIEDLKRWATQTGARTASNHTSLVD